MEQLPGEQATMRACVLRVCHCALLVCDLDTNQQAMVHTTQACCYHVGDSICIDYNGAMTMSIPPQISAESIHRICC